MTAMRSSSSSTWGIFSRFDGLARAGVVAVLAALLAGCGATTTARAPGAPPAATQAAPVAVPTPTPAPFDWSQAVLYFVIVDRFADGDPANNVKVDIEAKGAFHGGDLEGLRAHLDEIASLGVNALWLTPVVKNIDGPVLGAGFPDWGYHGYWADDFYRLDGRFGTEEQLEALVEDCHRRGIKVLLDVVYNHAGYGSHYLTEERTKAWLRSTEHGGCGEDDLTSCVSGLPDFKTELPEVADFLMSAHLGLAKRVGVDGFRLDTVKHVDHPFWQEHRRRTHAQLGPGFFLLGEVWGGDGQVLDPWFAGDEIDAGFDFSFQGSTLGFVMGRGRPVAYDRYLKSRERIRAGYRVAHFLSSHDVPGALFQLGGDKELFRLAALLQLTSVGIPVIYYGEEVGRPGGDWPDNRSDMPWGERRVLPGAGKPRDEALRADYTRLIAIRKAHPALWRGTHSALVTDKDVLVFEQQDAASGDTVVVALNRGSLAAAASFKAPEGWGAGPVEDLWSGGDVSVVNGQIELRLDPRGARILVVNFTK